MESKVPYIFKLIILAAGKSTRFGENKLLQSYGRSTVIGCLIQKIEELAQRESRIEQVILVTNETTLKGVNPCGKKIQVVLNPVPEEGISHSIFLGLEAAGEADVYGFLVADQLALSIDTIQAMIERYKVTEKGILCAKKGENLGNPVFFHHQYVEELKKLQGDKGGKVILKKHLEDVTYFEIEDARELHDLDTKEDWTYFEKENENASIKR